MPPSMNMIIGGPLLVLTEFFISDDGPLVGDPGSLALFFLTHRGRVVRKEKGKFPSVGTSASLLDRLARVARAPAALADWTSCGGSTTHGNDAFGNSLCA